MRLRLAEPAGALPELAKVYDTVLPSRPGFFARNEAWWRRVVFDPADDRHGQSPLRCLLAEDDSGPRGYALYAGRDRWDALPARRRAHRARAGRGRRRSQRRALGDLLSRDLTSEFRLSRRPVDDPLLYQLADPRRAARG